MKKKLFVTIIAAVIVMTFAQQGITLADNVLPRITSIDPVSPVNYVALNN